MAETANSPLEIGTEAPGFELVDTAGEFQKLATAPEDVQATVVIFTCNHCPYALAWHDRLMDVARDYREQGVRFLAINSNDAERYPADSYEAMKERVEKAPWSMPYLHDSSQEVARAFGAQTTPDVFVLDRELKLRYRGAPDADYDEPSERAAWLREALDDLLAGRELRRAETTPVGCSIKWKPAAGA